MYSQVSAAVRRYNEITEDTLFPPVGKNERKWTKSATVIESKPATSTNPAPVIHTPNIDRDEVLDELVTRLRSLRQSLSQSKDVSDSEEEWSSPETSGSDTEPRAHNKKRSDPPKIEQPPVNQADLIALQDMGFNPGVRTL